MKLEESSVLVTGAGGFIGSHLVENLIKIGANVRAFVRYTSNGDIGNLKFVDTSVDNLEIFMGDLKDPYACRQAMEGIEYVFHLASVVSVPYSYLNPREFFENNVFFILNILQAAQNIGVKAVIHTSTSEVYGTAEQIPIPETHPIKAQSPYSASKIAADKIAESFYLSFESPVVIVRPFNTYGPRQSVRAIIPTIITQALSQNVILLGDTRPTRDFLYVLDTVAGFIQVAKKADKVLGKVINLGTGVEITIEKLAEKIKEITHSSSKIVFDAKRIRPIMSEVNRLCADVTTAKEVLGWTAETTLEKGLQDTVQWFKSYLSFYKPSQGYV
ncbi:MAG: GDP-mannose 4,6-dehydratase [Candidatus Thorarchaeota archaeon SMTZ1-45]|nr:MAG: NAD-dependent dehydratase [Candidatus Thorarchaeota archaeon SMTZ1-45]